MPQTQGSRCAMPEGREGEDPAQAMLAETEEPPDPRGPEAVRSRVRWSITESGLAQREFARRLGLDETKLSKALRGTRRFSPTELAQIADIADVTVTWLLSGIDPAPPLPGSTGTDQPAPVLLGTTQEDRGAASTPASHVEQPTQAPTPPSAPAIGLVQPSAAGAVPRPREVILEAAARLFAARGRHAVRLSEIAATCGVSTSAVYHYFTGKDELFVEALRHVQARAEHDRAVVLEHTDGPVPRLRELITLRLPTEGDRADEWSLRVQGWALSVAGAGSFTPRTGAYERWHGAVLAVLREGQEVDVIVPGPVEDLALQLTGLIDGLGTKVLTGMITVEDMGRVLDGAIDQLLMPPGRDPAAPHPEHPRRPGGEHR